MNLIKNIINQRYGRLTIIHEEPKRVQPNGIGMRMMRCICDCGTEIITPLTYLRSKKKKSCGCFKRECTIERSTSHGKSRTPLYRSWGLMKWRCNNLKAYKEHQYCDEWDSFEPFEKWSLANGWQKGFVLHHDGSMYSPQTCQWMSRSNHTKLHTPHTNIGKRRENRDNI